MPASRWKRLLAAGTEPVERAELPPGRSFFSIIATDKPLSCAAMAAHKPHAPAPMTSKSRSTLIQYFLRNSGGSADLLECCDRLVGRHHVGILVGHVEQVDGVRGERTVVAGILRNGAAEVIGKAINNRTAYAARCRTADNDHGIAALVDQVARQRCA